jgi:oligopeptide/dipeptide ABC transporter ATP-binding protein
MLRQAARCDRGRVNTLAMRTIDIFYAFPSVLLAIALSGASEPVWQCPPVAHDRLHSTHRPGGRGGDHPDPLAPFRGGRARVRRVGPHHNSCAYSRQRSRPHLRLRHVCGPHRRGGPCPGRHQDSAGPLHHRTPEEPRTGVLVKGARLETIPGSPPDLANLAQGCAFAPRCPFAIDPCRQAPPPHVIVREGHKAACIRTDATRSAAESSSLRASNPMLV